MRVLVASSLSVRAPSFASLRVAKVHCDLAGQLEDTTSILQHSGPYDAVVLELTAPREFQTVRSTLRAIRARELCLAAVVISDMPSVEDEASLLTAGADDILDWPLRDAALKQRLQALVRRSLGHVSAELRCGKLVLHHGQQSVTVDGRPVRLTRREFEVLEMLMLRPGVPITTDRLMTALYGGEDGPNERILDVFICKLRRKLAAASADGMIRTVWGHGYRIDQPLPAAAMEPHGQHPPAAEFRIRHAQIPPS